MTVSWFSAGVSSAVATWLYRDKIDKIIYQHIDDQHPDTMRFVKDCESWFGKPVEIMQSPYKSVENACRAMSFIAGPHGAVCTRLLKRRLRQEWEREMREKFEEIVFCYVWGMDVDEAKPRPPKNESRCDSIRSSMPGFHHLFPLVENEIKKEEAHAILEKAGIKRPAMYDLGYHNNNCVGCVKGKMGYWNKIRIDFPEVFEKRAKLERIIGASCINGTYLDELDPNRGRDQNPIVPECGAMCEVLSNEETSEEK